MLNYASTDSEYQTDAPPTGPGWRYRVVIGLLLGAIIGLDTLAPMGAEGGIPYAAVAVFSYWVLRPRYGHLVTVLATAMLVYNPFVDDFYSVLSLQEIDRYFAIANLWLIVIPFFLMRKYLLKKYDADRIDFEQKTLQVQAELRRSENRYRDFAESSTDGRWEIDKDLNYSYLSENYFSMTGFARELTIGTSRADFILAENNSDLIANHMQTIHTRRPFHDFRYKTVNSVKGERFWLENGKPIFDDQGSFRGYRGSLKDITDLTIAEAKTRDTIKLFHSAIENLSDGFILVDSNRKIAICNQKMLEFNTDIADVMVPGASLNEIALIRKERGLRPFDGPALTDVLNESDDAADLGANSFLRKFKDGRQVIVKYGKLPDNGFVVTETDISALVKAQEEAVEVSRHYRRAFDATPVMLHYIDQDQKVVQVNRCWLTTMGYSIDEVLDHSISEFLTDEYKQQVGANEFKAKLKTGGIAPGTLQQFVTKEGEIIDVLLTVVPDHELQPNGIRYLVCSLNITEQLKVDRMKGEFVSVVSHELRTPLTSIVGALGLLEGGASGTIPDEMRAMVSLAKSNADRLVRLINDILDVERIEAGEVAFRNEVLDIDASLSEAVESCRPYADMNNVSFRITGSIADGKIWADRDRFVQVLTNLLSNAAKFSPSGENVEINVNQINQDVRIEVKDKGPGIPMEFRDIIFEKFSQADSSDARNSSGTGLGLNIAKTIVQKMRGTIGFEDRAGGGTVFYVIFPLKKTAGRVS